MACPSCDHTMQSLRPKVFWCPRCGTIKDENGCESPTNRDELKERHDRLVDAVKAVNELTSQPVELPASEWWDAMNMALHALRAELENDGE